MRLKTLQLSNFKGIKSLVLDAEGGDVAIYGDNATGKTTIADGLCWLLFDKDYSGNAQFEIKTLQADGEPIHQLQHEVEGVFDCGGKNITMKKVYTEKWTKKRGSSHSEFSGHSTDHFIDEVPVQKKDYSAKVAEIAPEEMFRLLTSPAYFASTLKWDKRREILLDVCGNVTDSDVIASDKTLNPLLEILKDRTQDDHLKVVKATMSKINESLKQIPIRIDEALKSTNTENIDLPVEEANLSAVRGVIDALKSERAKIEAGGQSAEIKKQIAEITAVIVGMETARKQAETTKLDDLRAQEHSSVEAISTLAHKIITLKGEIERLSYQMKPDTARLDAQMAELRAEWDKINVSAYSYEEKTCLTCGQTIPEDPDAEEKFNDRKKRRLDEINVEGRDLKKRKEAALEDYSKAIEASTGEIDKRKAEIVETQNKIVEAEAALEKIRAEMSAPSIKVTPSEEYVKAEKDRDVLADRLKSLDDGKTEAEIARIDEELVDMGERASEVEGRIAQAKEAKKAQARAEELRTEEKKLSKEYDRLSGELRLLDRFTEAKVSLLEDKVAAHFDLARFKLFERQINGGINPMCEVVYNGVPFGTNLNDGARINVGLDIIKTLSKHYGVTLPVIIDNAESITQLIPMDCQVIKLVVSREDKTLRIEAEKQKEEEVA
jgi:DNA repair exonuclease SbcCD ATPase subunit